LTREQENVAALNADLQHELDMYKSVMITDKPRTHITRVQRIPLSNVTRSLNANMNVTQLSTQVKATTGKPTITNSEAISGDMTLDELI